MRRRGIGLLEVVIVIGIIALLAALVFNLASPARENARESACMSNMRQIYSALQAYAEDYPGGDSFGLLNGLVPIRGSRYLTEYGAHGGVRNCPVASAPPDELSSNYAWPIAVAGLPMDRQSRLLYDRVRQDGGDTEIVVCGIHDDTYYYPRERDLDRSVAGRFEIRLCLNGHVRRIRRYGM